MVDAATVIATHLSHVLQSHAHELLGHEEAQQLLNTLAKATPRLIEELVPKVMPLATVVRVLQGLLSLAKKHPVKRIEQAAAIAVHRGAWRLKDLRRLIERGADLRTLRAADVMHAGPKLVSADALAVDAAEVMEQCRITSVLVVDANGMLAGALNSNDLMRAKVI